MAHLRTVPILRDMIATCNGDDEIILMLVKYILQIDLKNVDGIIDLGRAILFPTFPKTDTKDVHLLLFEFCSEFQKIYNLFLSCVEGQHRMLASSLAWTTMYNSGQIPTLLNPNPTSSFFLNVLKQSSSFESAMKKVSIQ